MAWQGDLGCMDEVSLNMKKQNNRIYEKKIQSIESYSLERGLTSTERALQIVCKEINNKDVCFDEYYKRALAVTNMLIDLHPVLNEGEEDILLSSALLHAFVITLPTTMKWQDFLLNHGFERKIIQTIYTSTKSENSEDENDFLGKLCESRLALLIRLTERSCYIEQLYRLSSWEAEKYVRETKKIFFPVCIYAIEHYPALAPVISILKEKMRSLIDVTSILSVRFRELENSLIQEKLTLMEENSRIRVIIEQLRSE